MTAGASRIAGVGIEPYTLPFTRPWRTRHGAVATRRGWLIRVTDDTGAEALGEAAPWPDAGTETEAACEAALAEAEGRLRGLAVAEALDALTASPLGPAARCGIEAALLGLTARRAGRPLRQLLSSASLDSVAVNAACGAADDGLAARVARAAAAGFSVFKVKLGLLPWPAERARLEALELPAGGRLRLDANGAWSAEGARVRLRELAPLPIDCVEEPLDRFDQRALRRLQDGASFALALDESLAGAATEGLVADCPVRRVVLKPTVLGGARRTVALAGMAADAGIEVVVTTTLEAAVGRRLAVEVAAATGSTLAHGLDTGRWLARDVGAGPETHGGRIRLDGV